MCSVCGLRLCANCGVWPAADKNCYLQLTGYKCIRSRFLNRNVFGHAAVVSSILQLQLTLEIEKL